MHESEGAEVKRECQIPLELESQTDVSHLTWVFYKSSIPSTAKPSLSSPYNKHF